MSKIQNYRFKCQNNECGYEGTRAYKVEEFEKLQYPKGISCFYCGFPRMAVMKSGRLAKDGFKPGLQRSINEYCETYSEYKRKLKERGLIELGYEDLPEDNGYEYNYWNEDVLKRVYKEHGVKLTGNEIEALKSGKIA